MYSLHSPTNQVRGLSQNSPLSEADSHHNGQAEMTLGLAVKR